MKQILFPTTYSEHSKIAFRYAQKLAQYFEASITLVHIYKKTLTATTEESSEQEWNQKWNQLNEFADEMNSKQFKDVPLEFLLVEGSVVDEVLKLQQEQHFDLMVMGIRRHNLIDRLFGNISHRLIDETKCPLLLVPPGTKFKSIKKILYGTAFDFGDEKAVEKLLDWCLAFGSTLDVLHVHKIETAQSAKVQMDALSDKFQEEQDAAVINIQLQEGSIQEVIHKHINESDSQLLAVHRRKKGLLKELIDGSLTKVMADQIQIPFLILKA